MNNYEDVKTILFINNIIILLCHPLFIATGAAIERNKYLDELSVASLGGFINALCFGGGLMLLPDLEQHQLHESRSKNIAAIFIMACGLAEILSAGVTGKVVLEQQYSTDVSVSKMLINELIGLTIALLACMSGYGLYRLSKYSYDSYGRFFPNHTAVVVADNLTAMEETKDDDVQVFSRSGSSGQVSL